MNYTVTYIDESTAQVGPIATVMSKDDGVVSLMRQNAQAYNAGRKSHIANLVPSPCGNVRVQVTERSEGGSHEA